MSEREILFKGKRLDDAEWVEGYYAKFDQLSSSCIYYVYKGHTLVADIEPETVCQYTGLTDKNGKKIFEGDIVKHDVSDTIGIVKWYCEDYVGWCVDDIQIDEQQFTDEMWNECEVIGNIFDNPELLNKIIRKEIWTATLWKRNLWNG